MSTLLSAPADINDASGSARHPTGILQWLLGKPEMRTKAYTACAIGLFIIGLLAMGVRVREGAKFNFAVSDGEGYFAYLPSLVIDHDLDFSNNVAAPDMVEGASTIVPKSGSKTELGYLRDKYPIGFALSVSPAFGLAHALTLAGHALLPAQIGPPDGFGLAYQILTAAMVALFGFFAMLLIDRTIVRSMSLDGRAIGLGVLFFWIGTHYVYYFARHPFMVHVVSGFWITCVVFLWMDIRERLREHELDWWQPFALCFSFTMAVICRNTNVFILPLILHLLWITYKEGMVGQLMRNVPLALLGLAPMALQMDIWHIMTGHWLVYSYGDEKFNFDQPNLIKTLISSRHGLLSWAPLLCLSFIGIAFYLFGKRKAGKPLLWNLLISFALLWYVNSSWHAWSFGFAFGGRAFLELASLFVIGLALYFDRIRRASRVAKVFTVGFIALSILVTYGLLAAYETKKIPRDDYLFNFEKPAPVMTLSQLGQ